MIERAQYGRALSRGVVAILMLVGCTQRGGDNEATGASSLALTPGHPPPANASSYAFNLTYPAGYDVTRVAVGATDDVGLGPDSRVLAEDGGGGVVTNTGDDVAVVGPRAQLGELAVVFDAKMEPGARLGRAVAGGHVRLSPGATVGALVENATLMPLAERVVRVSAVALPNTSVCARAGDSVRLVPGTYREIVVEPGAKLNVAAGTYVVERFDLGGECPRNQSRETPATEANAPAEVVLDSTGGSAFVYATAEARWRGLMTGDASRFVFGLLAKKRAEDDAKADDRGQPSLELFPGFRGTALVPYGTLVLGVDASSDDARGTRPSLFHGTFFAKSVRVGPRVTVQKEKTPFLIGDVKISKTTLCAGEQAEVTMTGAVSAPGTTARIQGVVGAHQFLEFANAPGPRWVTAAVFGPEGRADFVTVPVSVQQCDVAPTTQPRVGVHFRGGRQANEVEFTVHELDVAGRETSVRTPATYVWSFGDGTTAIGSSSLLAHDYSASVDPKAEYNYFDASVTVTTSLGTETARKIVPVWNLYAANRAKGVIRPRARFRIGGTTYAATLFNDESTPLSITSARVDFAPCDPGLDVRRQVTQAVSVQIPALGTGSVSVQAPPSIPDDVCGVNVHLMGTTAGGVVYASSYTRINENKLLVQPVTEAATVALLNQASAATADPNRFDEVELRQLVADGRLPRMPASIPPGTVYADPGQECSPGDLSSPPGLVCQPTRTRLVVRSFWTTAAA